eukprot:1151362-Pelagomonas_calceolata.AAC.3
MLCTVDHREKENAADRIKQHCNPMNPSILCPRDEKVSRAVKESKECRQRSCSRDSAWQVEGQFLGRLQRDCA